MATIDEPAYMLAARNYVRYGASVFTISTATVEKLVERIDRLEAENSRLHAAAMRKDVQRLMHH